MGYVPRWAPGVGVVVLIIWIMTDPVGLATVIGDFWDGIMTFVKELG